VTIAHDPIVAFGIAGLAVLVAALFVMGVAWSATRAQPPQAAGRQGVVALVGVTAWYALSGVLAGAGLLARFDLRPPPMAPFMASVLILGVVLGLSPLGRRLARTVPLFAVVGAQGFRLPLELVMHHAANRRIMPAQLSYSGYNFDILVGALALPIGWLLARGLCPRWLVWSWNLLGFATLTVIAIIAVATTPAVAAFGSEPHNLNLWVTHFPYVWLPAGPVLFAIASHIVIARRLLSVAAVDADRPGPRQR
jgi:hypothetical protein